MDDWDLEPNPLDCAVRHAAADPAVVTRYPAVSGWPGVLLPTAVPEITALAELPSGTLAKASDLTPSAIATLGEGLAVTLRQPVPRTRARPANPGSAPRLPASARATSPALQTALGYAASITGVSRLAMVWRAPGRSRVDVATWVAGCLTAQRISVPRLASCVAEELTSASFMCRGTAVEEVVVHAGGRSFRPWQGAAIEPWLAELLGKGSIVTVPVPGERPQARLFMMPSRRTTRNALLDAEMAALGVATLLQQARSAQAARKAASTAERRRLAGDLHDGLLQVLAGASLQVHALVALVGQNPEQAKARLGTLEAALVAEHRALRLVVDALRSRPGSMAAPQPDLLVGRLGDLVVRLQRLWDLAIVCRVEPEGLRVNDALGHDLVQLVSEAVANAARHGRARNVTVTIDAQCGPLTMTIEDDGCGFAPAGRLGARPRVPESLRERVAALDGLLMIDSGATWTKLELILPAVSGLAG
jgi:signal transduction histidine kinase